MVKTLPKCFSGYAPASDYATDYLLNQQNETDSVTIGTSGNSAK